MNAREASEHGKLEERGYSAVVIRFDGPLKSRFARTLTCLGPGWV